MKNLIIGFILSIIIAFAAYKKQSLSKSGVVAAVIVSTLLFFFGGYVIWITLMMFFISSSLFTKFKNDTKKSLQDINEKGGNRDWAQVLANGGLPLIFAFVYYITKNETYLLISAVSIASSNADTWASELGVLSRGKTVSLLTLRPVAKGTSGGVSLLGTASSLFGGLFIGVIYMTLKDFSSFAFPEFDYGIMVITLGGFAGSIIDSLLGGTIQGKYECQICHKLTEKKNHHGEKTVLKSGLGFVTNDVVNFTSSLLASLLILFMI